MSIVNQYDKRSGITYVYESKSYWDKEKKQPRSNRTLIGRLDPDTGKIIPTDGRGKNRNPKNLDNPAKRGPVPTTKTERLFYGATYLFDQIGIESVQDSRCQRFSGFDHLMGFLFEFRKHGLPIDRTLEVFQILVQQSQSDVRIFLFA